MLCSNRSDRMTADFMKRYNIRVNGKRTSVLLNSQLVAMATGVSGMSLQEIHEHYIAHVRLDLAQRLSHVLIILIASDEALAVDVPMTLHSAVIPDGAHYYSTSQR
jgi:hypothetical protein